MRPEQFEKERKAAEIHSIRIFGEIGIRKKFFSGRNEEDYDRTVAMDKYYNLFYNNLVIIRNPVKLSEQTVQIQSKEEAAAADSGCLFYTSVGILRGKRNGYINLQNGKVFRRVFTMRTIKAKPITVEAFRPYGSFTDLLNPEGYSLGDFYQDRLLMHSSGVMQTAFSPLLIHKPERMIVSQAEFHNSTQEGILCLDDDMVIHVAPAGKDPTPELTEAFLVKKGTMVCLNTGVWHLAPMAVNLETAHVLIVLPERIYNNDCIVVDYPEDQQVEIEL